MKFEPAKDYENLLRQSYALASLVNTQEKELSFFRKKDYSLSERKIAALETSLESEKTMNSRLTEELERLIPNVEVTGSAALSRCPS